MAILLGAILSGCGQSKLSKQFNSAAKKQSDLDSMQLELFRRSPTIDGANFSLTARSNIDGVPRSPISFPNLKSVTGTLQSSQFDVVDDLAQQYSPSFFTWAGKLVPNFSSDFRTLMAYSHLQKAYNYAQGVLGSSYNLEDPIYDPNSTSTAETFHVFPLIVEANKVGDATQTQYDYLNRSILFYRDYIETRYATADEADVIYHEFGHVVQHVINPLLFVVPGNRDLNAMYEGLSDFFAAAVARDDKVLTYLESNSPPLFSDTNQQGPIHSRRIDNNLAFPAAFTGAHHLDGRVLASALNEFRKYLQGSGMGEEAAWDNTFKLSHTALNLMTSNLSFRGYSSALISQCGSLSWCDATKSSVLSRILTERGIRLATLSAPVTTALPMYESPSSGLSLNSVPLGFMEIPGLSNQNGKVDPCEVVLIYPNVKGHSTHELTNATMQLLNLAAPIGFTPYSARNSAGDVGSVERNWIGEQVTNSGVVPAHYTNITLKDFPRLAPGENYSALASNLNSRLYQTQQKAYFSRRPSSTTFPATTGWMVRATQGQARIQANFKMIARSASSLNDVYGAQTFSQQVTIESTSPPVSCN